MKSLERRLRALEERSNVEKRKPVRSIICQPGESVASVCQREGIDEAETFVIARMIVVPGDTAPKVAEAYRERTYG